MGVAGEIRVPGLGLTTALVPVPAGNQLTTDAAGSLSHVRGAAATSIEPASPVWASVIWLRGCASVRRRRCSGWPYASVRTGRSNDSRSGEPDASVTYCSRGDALGVRSPSRVLSRLPASHAIQP